jgi:hypothetical protein
VTERPEGPMVAQPLLVGPVSVHEVSSSHRCITSRGLAAT